MFRLLDEQRTSLKAWLMAKDFDTNNQEAEEQLRRSRRLLRLAKELGELA